MGEKTLWDQDATVVLTLGSSILHEVSDSSDNIWEGLTSVGALLGDDDHIWMSLEGALKSKMRWISTHESNEIPVLNSGGTVSQHVSNKLRVDLGSGIESETSLEVAVSDVVVNGSWNVDHICVDLVCLEVLRNLDAVSQSVSGSNNNETSQAILLALFS